MQDELTLTRDHYLAAITDPAALLIRIASALDASEAPITAEALGRFDQFHIGGLASSIELDARLRIDRDAQVLDAGSGLGGPSRYLAQTFGCQVTGVDLAPAYVEIARLLAERAGMADRVRYLAGSITDLPFIPATFDLVWTQHVVMNIRDRDSLYREIRRVLRTGGQFAFYDPYVPDDGEAPLYPTPWADSAATSTLLTEAETCAALAQAGLQVQTWDDVSEKGKAWIAQQQQQKRPADVGPGAPPFNLGWVVGPRMPGMVANFARNIQEGRIRLVMGVCKAV